MFKSRPKKNYLDMVPVRNVKEFLDEGGVITLLIPRFKSAWMQKWFILRNRSKHIRVHMDANGSKLWRLIDGQKNAGELSRLLGENEKTENNADNQVELRVTGFLSKLYKNRFILFR